MLIDDPKTLAEITAVFEAYEKALLENDAETLDAMFLHSEKAVRYGVVEVQYGIEEVRSFRAAQKPFERTLSRTVITTYGRDVAVASTLFHRRDLPGLVGRQMQTWLRTPGGWRVVAAHVSMMQDAQGSAD
jgi:hypothetical protein